MQKYVPKCRVQNYKLQDSSYHKNKYNRSLCKAMKESEVAQCIVTTLRHSFQLKKKKGVKQCSCYTSIYVKTYLYSLYSLSLPWEWEGRN